MTTRALLGRGKVFARENGPKRQNPGNGKGERVEEDQKQKNPGIGRKGETEIGKKKKMDYYILFFGYGHKLLRNAGTKSKRGSKGRKKKKKRRFGESRKGKTRNRGLVSGSTWEKKNKTSDYRKKARPLRAREERGERKKGTGGLSQNRKKGKAEGGIFRGTPKGEENWGGKKNTMDGNQAIEIVRIPTKLKKKKKGHENHKERARLLKKTEGTWVVTICRRKLGKAK